MIYECLDKFSYIKLENENKEKFIIITTNILSHMTIGHENIILESKHTIFFLEETYTKHFNNNKHSKFWWLVFFVFL